MNRRTLVPLMRMSCLVLAGTLYAKGPVNDWLGQVEFANALVDRGDLVRAETLYTKALNDAKADGDDLRAGLVWQNLGRLLAHRGKLREAEVAFLRAIQSLSRSRAIDDRLLVRACVGLSVVYLHSGQYPKAETLIRRVLAEHPAGADPDKASLMGNLGVILVHKQRLAEAEQVLRDTAQLCAGVPGTEMQEVGAAAVANLAGLQMRTARTADAIDSYRQAVAIMEAVPAPSPTTLTVTLAEYAKAVRSSGDDTSAEKLYRRAITIAETQLGPGHIILAGILTQYAELLRDAGRKSEARELVNAARRIQSEHKRENLTGHTIDVDSLLHSR